ncbi:hypothetical protein V8E54_012155 [Elaphomyces granulatus]
MARKMDTRTEKWSCAVPWLQFLIYSLTVLPATRFTDNALLGSNMNKIEGGQQAFLRNGCALTEVIEIDGDDDFDDNVSGNRELEQSPRGAQLGLSDSLELLKRGAVEENKPNGARQLGSRENYLGNFDLEKPSL